jgi:hypothetical protein
VAETPTIRGDKLVLAIASVLRTLVVELDRTGAIKLPDLLSAIDDTVATHREDGDTNQLADAIEAIRSHLSASVSRCPRSDH